MPIREIFLEEAIRTINYTKFFMWFTSGEIIENAFNKTGCVSRIGVSRHVSRSGYSVTLALHNADGNLEINNLGNFSSLVELRKRFPQLFKVTGNLFVC